MQEHLNFVDSIINKDTFGNAEVALFDQWLNRVSFEYKSGQLKENDLSQIRARFSEFLSVKTIIGCVFSKPHGYAGDYEIIDKLYRQETSNDSMLGKWDQFTQSQKASVAVRNRKTYFHALLEQHSKKSQNQVLNVLNVASGPGRDMYEFLMKYNSEKIIFDCVEYDPNAISYASELCREFLPQITFNRANAFKFKTDRKYELIWSAGLFDYFNDKRFKFLLKCLYSFLAPGGELVIGNFSENNPTRNYMEILGDWILHHRSKKLLINLAEECGVSPDSIRVGEEAEGINLFLHITKPSES